MSDEELTNAERCYRWLGDLDVLLGLSRAEWRAALAGAMVLAESSGVVGGARAELLEDELAGLQARTVELRRLINGDEGADG